MTPSTISRSGRWVGCRRRWSTAFTGPELHARHRGGADDRRRRDARPRQRDRVAARGRRRDGDDQARAHGVGARDRDRAVPRHAPRPATSCARCARRCAQTPRRRRACTIGSAGTHPFAMWEDQRIVARPRYRDLVAALRFVARQELIFGLHVHVGHRRPRQGDPRRQRDARPRARAAGAERQLAVLARPTRPACSPRARRSSAPSRASASRPPTATGTTTSSEIGFMVDSRRDRGLHVPLVRRPPAPEPRHGRDPRVRRADARRAHARRSRRSSRRWSRSSPSTSRRASSSRDYPWQMLDENKWLAARHGLDGELVDLPDATSACATKALARRLLDRAARARRGPRLGRRARRHRRSAGARQRRRAPGRRLRGQPRPARGHGRDRRRNGALGASGVGAVSSAGADVRAGADLFVVCKNCESEVSPYVTECPYCGQRRAQAGAEDRARRRGAPQARARDPQDAPRRTPRAPRLGRLRPGEIPGLRADGVTRPWATILLVAACLGVYLLAAAGAFNEFELIVARAAGRRLLAPVHRELRPHQRRRGDLRRRRVPAGDADRRRRLRLAARAPPRRVRSCCCCSSSPGRAAMSSRRRSTRPRWRSAPTARRSALLCCWAVPDLLAWRARRGLGGRPPRHGDHRRGPAAACRWPSTASARSPAVTGAVVGLLVGRCCSPALCSARRGSSRPGRRPGGRSDARVHRAPGDRGEQAAGRHRVADQPAARPRGRRRRSARSPRRTRGCAALPPATARSSASRSSTPGDRRHGAPRRPRRRTPLAARELVQVAEQPEAGDVGQRVGARARARRRRRRG